MGHVVDVLQDLIATVATDGGTLAERLGRCYELPGRWALHNPEAVVVHGSVRSSGCPRLDHAWIEEPDGTLFDPVLDARFAPVVFSRSFRPVVHVRYRQEEAMVEMLRNRHWGPWPDGRAPFAPSDEGHS